MKQVTFDQKMKASVERPTLKLSFLTDSFVSEQNMPLQELTKSISLQTPFILSQSQINLTKSALTYNEAVIYSLISLSVLCLITGSFELFWNLMDQLQYLSYIKYVNIKFPPNFKLISISPAIQALGIDNLLDLIQQGDNSQIQVAYRFVIDDISIRFLDNFSSSAFCLTTTSLGQMFFKSTQKLLYSLQPWLLQKMSLKIAKGYYNWLIFRVIIQLIQQIHIFPQFFCIFSHFVKNFLVKLHQNTNQYQSLFEGVQDSKYLWISQYNTILLIKKLIFISLIVFIYTILILFINRWETLNFSNSYKLNQNHYEYYKIIITESFIIFNTITFILSDYSQVFRLNSSFNANLGWVHIYIFSYLNFFINQRYYLVGKGYDNQTRVIVLSIKEIGRSRISNNTLFMNINYFRAYPLTFIYFFIYYLLNSNILIGLYYRIVPDFFSNVYNFHPMQEEKSRNFLSDSMNILQNRILIKWNFLQKIQLFISEKI